MTILFLHQLIKFKIYNMALNQYIFNLWTDILNWNQMTFYIFTQQVDWLYVSQLVSPSVLFYMRNSSKTALQIFVNLCSESVHIVYMYIFTRNSVFPSERT